MKIPKIEIPKKGWSDDVMKSIIWGQDKSFIYKPKSLEKEMSDEDKFGPITTEDEGDVTE